MASETPLWRSLLFVPAHVDKYVPKAAASGADVVILDLEDGVPQEAKQMARDRVASSAAMLSEQGIEVAVRINADPASALQDLKASVCASVSIIVLPKVEENRYVLEIAAHLDDLEDRYGLPLLHTNLIALIESPAGLLNAASIAKAHPRLAALNLGTEDFAFEMGIEPEWTGLVYPCQQVAIAAKAAGIVALGYAGSIAQFIDITAFEEMVTASSRLGFEGGFAIHPEQVPALNRAFSPDEKQITWARKVIAAFKETEENGMGAISVDGKMVDLPIANRAEQIYRQAIRLGLVP